MGTRGRGMAMLASVLMVVTFAAVAPAQAAGPTSGHEDPVTRAMSEHQSLRTLGTRSRESAGTIARHHGPASRSPIPRADAIALDRSTGTLYVAGGGDNGTVYVVDARTCNAVRSACRPPIATTSSGHGPAQVVVDHATQTVYQAYVDDGTVAVIDGAHCNARVTSGCSRPPVLFSVEGPLGLAIDPRTRTLYVGSFADRVTVVDLRTCNRTITSGCGSPVATIAADGPAFPTVDTATDTLYLPENGPSADGSGTTLALVDLRTCHAPAARACAVASRAPMSQGPVAAIVDDATNTIYASAQVTDTVSVLDRSRCNAHDTTRCGRANLAGVHTKLNPGSLALDARSRTVFVVSGASDTVGAIDTRRCRASDTSGCAAVPRTLATGGQPSTALVGSATRTLYVSESVDGYVTAYSTGTCNAVSRRGCRREAPTAPGPQFGDGLDPLRHTAYAALADTHQLGLLDTAVCNASHPSGCSAARVIADVGAAYGSLGVVPQTHTLYASNSDDERLDIIDTATCNATHPSGCAAVGSIAVGDTNDVLANSRTGTVYLTRASGDVSVFDGRRCNASTQAGCAALLTIHVADGLNAAWIDEVSNTFYVATSADAVALLPGSACDRRAAACAVVGTTPVGVAPIALAGEPGTHTVYATNFAYGDDPGTVSIIDTRHCSSVDTSGCGATWPTIATARSPFGAVVDPGSHTLFVTNFFASRVTLIDAGRCNALDRSGCVSSLRQIATGQITAVTRIDPIHRTAYVLNSYDRTLSVISTRHPCRTGLCFR